jgi:glycosyltransferase involved in cell wall biosynthesis
MRLLIVCGNFHFGGAETVAADLTAGLVADGHHVVVASVAGDGPMAEIFARRGATVCRGLARCSVDPLAPLRFARLIRRERIDGLIVLDPLRNGLLYAIAGSLLSGRKVGRLCWCHSWPGGQAGRFVGRLAAYYRLGLLAAIVCVSPAQRRKLASTSRLLPRRALAMIRNGLDLSKLKAREFDRGALQLPPGKKIVLQVANLMPDKDFQTLLNAVRLLAAKRGDFHLLLVGRGTDGPELAEAIRHAGAEQVVTALGGRCDVPAILAAADVFVLASKAETFGVAPLEAMAAGLPVVLSNLPAFDDLFQDGREGLKVQTGNPQALAEALATLLDDPDLARRMGQAGRQRAKRFSSETMVRRFERLLGVVVSTGRQED